MKNITISIDDDTHRRARIYAAAHGTSLSALFKDYLGKLVDDKPAAMSPAQRDGVREMPMPFAHQGATPFPAAALPRKPGRFREMVIADDFDTWPEDILASFDDWPEDNDETIYPANPGKA